jgi:AcrR family transcriptional regulator
MASQSESRQTSPKGDAPSSVASRHAPHGARPVRLIQAKQERSRSTREALLDAFMELLHERPYAEVGLADIAHKAGMTTGAVYARFGSKRGLGTALHERFAERSAVTMETWGARPQWSSAPPRRIIESWTRGAVSFCRMHRPLFALMMNDPELQDRYADLTARPPRILARLLRKVMPDRVDPRFDRDVEWAARAALAVLERFDLDDDELCERIDGLLCRSVGVK